MKMLDKINSILNERPHYMKTYGKELEALDDAFDALNRIKSIEDVSLRKKINSMRINLKYLIEILRSLP